MGAIDYTIDWAQRAIDLVKSGAPDYKVVEALANREQKIKDLGLSDKQAGSTSALKDYLSALSVAASPKSSVLQSSQAGQGIVELKPDPLFNPNDFIGTTPLIGATAAQTGYEAAGGTGSRLAGYLIVGLVAVVLLDRIMK